MADVEEPGVSCVIPTHGRPRLLAQALDSVAHQTYLPVEVWVVDDLDDADTKRVVEAADEAAPFPVRYVSHGGTGASASRNAGSERATQLLVALLDDDDCWAPTFLERCVELIVELEVDAAVSPLWRFCKRGVAPLGRCAEHLEADEVLARNPGVTGSNVVARGEVFIEVGGYDESLPVSNDKDFFYRFLSAGKTYAVTTERLAYQRVHDTSHRLTDASAARINGMHLYKAKWASVLSSDDRKHLDFHIARDRVRAAQTLTAKSLHAVPAVLRFGPGVVRKHGPQAWTPPPSDAPLAVRSATGRIVSKSPRGLAGLAVRLLRLLPPLPFTIVVHLVSHRRLTLFRQPETFSELVSAKKLYDHDTRYTQTADKIAVRQWVADRVGGKYLVDLLHVGDDPEQIPFDGLPSRFVVKASHGSNMHVIVRDPEALDRDEIVEEARCWMRTDYYDAFKEPAYKAMARTVMVEAYIGDENGSPADYKFFVFRGRVAMVQVDSARETFHTRDLFDEQWQRLDVRSRFPMSTVPPERPEHLDEMLEVASRLGEEFDFVRVDLYDTSEAVKFGELTHYPGAGKSVYTPASFDLALGEFWRNGAPLPDHYRRAL